jgi:hypothetical protein
MSDTESDEMFLLAKRAIACKGWRWLPGMLRLRVTPPSQRNYLLREGRELDGGDTWDYAAWPVVPDLTDAATIGCLLALVRVAYADPYASVWYSSDHNHSGDRWSYYSKAFTFTGHATEAEALVVALESAL